MSNTFNLLVGGTSANPTLNTSNQNQINSGKNSKSLFSIGVDSEKNNLKKSTSIFDPPISAYTRSNNSIGNHNSQNIFMGFEAHTKRIIN